MTSLEVSGDNLKSEFEQLLRRYRRIQENEDIFDLTIGGILLKGETPIPVTYKTNKLKGVKIITHNG